MWSAALTAALVCSPASADQVPASASNPSQSAADDGISLGADRLSIGLGVASTPTYIGSDSSIILPTAALQGQVSGISFNSQGTAFYVDAVPSSGKTGWKLELGPLVALRLDRNANIGDSAVRALGKRKIAVELGGTVGIQRTGVVTSPYDTFSASISYQHDVAGAHSSYLISPELDYDTPLSKYAMVSFSVSADYVGKGFGRYYYDVDPAGSAASGLRMYDGADKAGWKDWNLSMFAVHSLTGNLTHGLGIFATGGYQRLLGSYSRSPIVADVGSANQWSGAIGIEYTF